MLSPSMKIILKCVLMAGTTAAALSASQMASRSEFDAILTPFVESGRFSGVVVAARNSHAVFESAYGQAVVEWSTPNTTETKFEIASLTKQFTGAAVLLLAQDGKLSPNDPVSRLYSEAPATWAGITVRQLATHTSGLPTNGIGDYPKGTAVPYTLNELLQTFRDRPLNFPPGKNWKYTNTEYYLLAYVIEKVSGAPYAQFLQDRIFSPLKMHNSGFVPTTAVVPGKAFGYVRERGILRHRDYFDRSLEIGAGGMHTTVDDLLLWDAALSSETLLKKEWIDLMFEPSQPGTYGYGWFIDRKAGKVFHEGGDPGFSAFEIRYPERRLFVAVLANLENAPVRDIAVQIADLLLN